MKPLKSTPLKLMSWLFLFVSVSFFIACKGKKKLITVDPEFSKYIDAYTAGVVSKKNAIKIVLASDAFVTHAVNETIKEELFDFSPSVEGKAYWTDARTIEFKPTKDLKPDELYEVQFSLAKVMNVPSKFRKFKFNIQTVKPSFQVEEHGLIATGKETMSLSGQIVTADIEESAKVEKLLSAIVNGSSQPIKWQHNEANKTHGFVIENIKRKKDAGKVVLSWNGAPLNVDLKDSKEVAVPAIGDFKVLGVRVVQEEEQYALVQFSDPILIGQQLDGLIAISNQENLSYTILGSEVKVYTSNKLDGSYTMSVNEGIENQYKEKLDKSFTSTLFFENRLPSVKIHGKGVLLPNSGGKIVLPFEAINLKAVDVSIIKIYESNIPQFLQTNKLDESEDLRRVAKPIVEATVRLDDDKTLNLHKKNRFSLDLEKYIKTEPGAIYHVHIGFRPDYSLYTCSEMIKKSMDEYYDEYGEGNRDGSVDDDDEFWSRYDSYYPYGYDWENRDNPCHQGYYNRERFASRNIISTNIGLTAKRGSNNQLFVAVNNIITTEPMNGVELQVLDYQQQIIGKANTNNDGIALIDFKRKPFLLIAKKGTEKSYLKLDEGGSLALSRFDVSGAEVKNGIKGFIFGERGVWRPGDSLFLGCIIEDKENKLPKEHPIEMELISPRGQLYKRLVNTNAEDGFNVFKTVTDPAAPTGNWLCRVKAGGATFEKKLKIETVMPNRLKIDLNFNGMEALGKNATTNATLSAKWLFGANAQNLKARVDAQLYRKATSFANFKDYVFDNPTSSFSSQSKTIFDGSLNETGVATINPQFDAGADAPGMLLANLMVKVFEPGGNFSIDNISMPYHPYSSYAGMLMPKSENQWGYLLSGKSHEVKLVDVNTNGNLVGGSNNFEVELYKVQWRWWWDNSGNDLTNFTQNDYNKFIRKETIALSNGKGVYNLRLNSGEYGRYLLLVKNTRTGHVTGQSFYVDDYNWQSHADNNDPSAAAMLSFTTDKPKYQVGDKVNLTIPSSANSRALISIETGSKVLKTYWVNTEKGETKFSFKVEKEMCPNVYINVSLIQPHAQTVNDLPIRLYGVAAIIVEDKNTILHPTIKMDEVLRPETNSSITVGEQNGKSMSYVIAVVDEGLLDLTRFKTPNPHDAFYAKEALGVKSWDVYDYVIGAWGGQLERILTIGGDAEAELQAKTRKANRFKPVVKFYGPFKSSGGSKTHQIYLPAYMGSVRAMVIAAGNGAYGMADKTAKVKSPLMILPTVPRVVGPGEEFKIPVSIFMEDGKSATPKLSMTNTEFFEVIGVIPPSNMASGEGMAYLSVRVKNQVGISKIKINASSGSKTAKYETEIDIRNPNPPITQVGEFTLQPNQTMNTSIAMIGDVGSSKATLEVSSIPAINLQKRLSYLIQYPHGCIEQTTSSVFPQLVLSQLTDIDANKKAQIETNVRIAIQKIQNFQQSDGGFSYWPSYGASDEWGTNYAGNFLLEASNRGYNVPSSMLQQWKSFERSKALAWNVTAAPYYGTDLMQAYRLYLLALAKSPEMGAMNRLKEFKFLTPEGKWRLAAAYHLSGQTQIALQLISGLPTTFATRPYAGETFGSDLRDQAMVLETLTLMGRKLEAEQLVRTVAAKLSQEQWYSTQTTAYALIAIAKYSGNNKTDKKITATGNAGTSKISLNSNSTISQSAISWQGNKANVQLKNTGNNVLYVRVINEGKPMSAAPVPVQNNPNILLVDVSYINNSGAAVDITKLKQGTDFIAKVTIKNPGKRGNYAQMALTQIFPSGWEILNTRLYNSEGAFKSSPSDYMDIKDDRVYHYFNIRQGETLTYYVQLNAAYLGKYYLPNVYAEAMYDNTINGGVTGKWVEVVE